MALVVGYRARFKLVRYPITVDRDGICYWPQPTCYYETTKKTPKKTRRTRHWHGTHELCTGMLQHATTSSTHWHHSNPPLTPTTTNSFASSARSNAAPKTAAPFRRVIRHVTFAASRTSVRHSQEPQAQVVCAQPSRATGSGQPCANSTALTNCCGAANRASGTLSEALFLEINPTKS